MRSFELSSELGRDVLMVRGFLTDVVAGFPPDRSGSDVSTVRWAFEANVIIELRDSMSNEILARTLDRSRIEGPFDAELVRGLTPRFTQTWSSLLVTRLGELSDFYPSRLRRLQDESDFSSE